MTMDRMRSFHEDCGVLGVAGRPARSKQPAGSNDFFYEDVESRV